MKKQSGLSLSELMIGLFLASLLSTILIQTYLLNKKNYFSLHQALSDNFEIQWAQDLLAHSIRRAGFTPCLNIEELTLVDRRTNKTELSGQNIEINKQDIQINRMDEHFSILTSFLSLQEILVSSSLSLRVGQSLIIADCQRGEVHRIKEKKKLPQGTRLTLTKPIFFTYPALPYVGQWIEERWFIKKNQEGVKAFYYQHLHSEELTPLIHSMKIKDQKRQGRKQIDIIWGLDRKKHQFRVLVRT
ncbi:PilW family protein [Legionella sp. km772]|uniref:PilW family protein n=1 Tax=Legionella sp. km772 TaxID=2498111 RepID=UPI000F8D3FFE|nr:prepilin-type N-terminal cleavage/methylation domain-containing protein [Legionella sp. km772]RUR04272.1 prepilin cleavage protein [Legionella sp. km772]